MLRDVEEVINSDSSGSPGSDRDSIDGTKRGMTPDDDEDNDRSPKVIIIDNLINCYIIY